MHWNVVFFPRNFLVDASALVAEHLAKRPITTRAIPLLTDTCPISLLRLPDKTLESFKKLLSYWISNLRNDKDHKVFIVHRYSQHTISLHRLYTYCSSYEGIHMDFHPQRYIKYLTESICYNVYIVWPRSFFFSLATHRNMNTHKSPYLAIWHE